MTDNHDITMLAECDVQLVVSCTEVDSQHVDSSRGYYVTVAHGKSSLSRPLCHSPTVVVFHLFHSSYDILQSVQLEEFTFHEPFALDLV